MKNLISLINGVRITRNDLFLMSAAFITYTGMYAVRKSFLAGQFTGEAINGFDFKTILVVSQVVGYMLSKFIGIKVVSECPANRRSLLLVGLVSFGLLMLLAFAYLPFHLKPLALFFNGLPLGIIFGLVLSYLEGRRNTELLAATLSATFVFSTGFIKTTGLLLMQDYGISEFMMPFVTGLIFFPPFLLSVWLLRRCKPPTVDDIALRTERIPMRADQRKDFLKKHGLTFGVLVIIYILLTTVRDFRDNFMVEFWSELNFSDQPEVITLTEIPIAMVVLVIAALGILIRSNRIAFKWGLYATVLGAILLLLSTFLFEIGLLSPINWMIWSGMGIYLPYILFHCVLFERFIALLRYMGTIGFLFYVADAFGYLVSVGVLISKEAFDYQHSWLTFFSKLNIYAALSIIAMTIAILILSHYEQKKIVAKTNF
ncbi:DUF5690 family protein [Fulvivirgaceae bacterium BMA12]|uniref:DUF5690 family protein n=1 Tax=Agaribacillus aureus TaxID=3051825 RepID=A0ABT8LG73_9BACT|nr:DUF5690 family protein [Fulvivirgaceae bacterium BMA12]